MKQTNEEQVQKGLEKLNTLKKMRGGSVLPFHKRLANDVVLLESFINQYDMCNSPEKTTMDPKVRELILMALGCGEGVQTTIRVHAQRALEHGATIEEINEVLRIIFFYCGASKMIPAIEIFEELTGSENL